MFTYYFCVRGLICTRISEVVGSWVKSLLKNDFHSHQTKMGPTVEIRIKLTQD